MVLLRVRARPRTFRSFLASLLTATCVLLAYSQAEIRAGYTVVTARSGSAVPVGSALFSYTNPEGVLVSQAGVGAAEPVRSGRIFVDQQATQTGIALVNPSGQDASVALTLRDASGSVFGRRTQALGAGKHLAVYAAQWFTDLPSGFTGSLTFDSDEKIAAIALRESRNAREEPLYTTLPVVDLGAAPGTSSVVFPQIAVGEGYSTQLVLINTTAQKISGQIRFTGSDGNPLSVQLRGVVDSRFSYEIDPQGTYRAQFDRPAGLAAGYAVATPDAGASAPSGSAIFQFRRSNVVVTEAGVAATPSTTSALVFVDNVGSYTGVALANPSDQPAEVTFRLLDRYGAELEGTTRTLDAKGHVAVFAHELFPELSSTFTGLIDIASSSPVVPITLKLTLNERGDQVLATLPVADRTKLPTAASVIFPHIAVGGGFSTRLVFINTDDGRSVGGKIAFYRSDSIAMTVSMGGRSDSQFEYEVAAGGGKQFLPGNTAKVASISILAPSSSGTTKEVTVNEGKSLRPALLVLDATGLARDDFDLSFSSLSSDVAAVDATGNIQGKKAGFSTLTISSGGVVTTAAATVVQVNAGVAGFKIQDVAQDLARRLYLAASSEHAVLLAEDLKQSPVTYAGIRKTPGLKNGARLDAQFRNPAFLAFDHAQGALYISDGANHVVRKVSPGTPGSVATVAGTGAPGSRDGAPTQAGFNNPQGLALDGRGNLWVVDSANHAVRRIRLQTGTVETIAGMPGAPGFLDGRGREARFRDPIGLAVETETIVQQLDRERRGLPPPPVRVLVADTGNDAIRRVTEDGVVETIGASSAGPAHRRPLAAVTPVLFDAPTALAVDPSGNVFVTESASGRIKTLLRTGDVVDAAQPGTFGSPSGIAVTERGRLVVADSNRTAQELVYGQPVITSITPDRVGTTAGATITIRGRNFAPDTLVIIAGSILADVALDDSETITLRLPAFPSGRTTVTVQHRGGIAQYPLIVEGPKLADVAAGDIVTVAGGSTFRGDGSFAASATIAGFSPLAMDRFGNLFLAESQRVRRIDSATSLIQSVAGTGDAQFSGDGGPAAAAGMSPSGITLDPAGNLIIADSGRRIRKVDAVSQLIRTIAGTGETGFGGDGGPALSATFQGVGGITTDASGTLYAVDGLSRIRRIDVVTDIVSTFAGNGIQGFSGDNGPAAEASLNFYQRGRGMVVTDARGNLFFSDTGNHVVRKVDAATGVITTVAGTGRFADPIGDGGLATAASLYFPAGLWIDTAGNLLISDRSHQRIRRVDAASRIIETVAGTGRYGHSGDGGRATQADVAEPSGVLSDAAGNLFFTERHRLRRVDAKTGIITTIAGTGQPVPPSDGELATLAELHAPVSVAPDGRGGMAVVEKENQKVRRIDLLTGILTTIAGTGSNGYSGDGGPATSAELGTPIGLGVDASGNVFIAEFANRIRMVSAASGVITTIAGNGQSGFSGDGGPAVEAALNMNGFSVQLAADARGNLLVPDGRNHRIRQIDAASGVITTVAGNGQAGFSGDGGPATAASLNEPSGVAFDAGGNLFIADTRNHRLRRVDARTGVITTIAGTGQNGFAGDGGPAASTLLDSPAGLAFDDAQNLYFADRGNRRIRRIDTRTGIITTVAGSGIGFGGDGGPAKNALVGSPLGVAFDGIGNLFILDGNQRIRAVRAPIP